MKTDVIQKAIDGRTKVYFCEGRNGTNQVVEGIPVAMYIDEQHVVVGLFIPNGIRVATVDAILVGVDPFEAQAAVSKKNRVIAAILEKCWEFSESEIGRIKNARKANVDITCLETGEIN